MRDESGYYVVMFVYQSSTCFHIQIYPLWFRSQGVSLSTSFNWALNLTVSETFLYLLQALKFGTWYLYAGCSLVAIVFFTFTLPETKGKSLEDMEALFSRPFWKLGKAK